MPCGKEHKKEMAALPKKDQKTLKHIGAEFNKLSKAGKQMDVRHDKAKMKTAGRGR